MCSCARLRVLLLWIGEEVALDILPSQHAQYGLGGDALVHVQRHRIDLKPRMNRRSKIVRALRGSEFPHDKQRIYARNLEVPSGGVVGTARAIAHVYSVFATGGRELGLRRETLDLLAAPATPPARGFYDECMKADGIQFSLGFMKPSTVWPFGSASSFGSPGSGGSLGFADPTAGVGYAYVTSQMGTQLTGDPRDAALRKALYSAIPGSPGAVERRVA